MRRLAFLPAVIFALAGHLAMAETASPAEVNGMDHSMMAAGSGDAPDGMSAYMAAMRTMDAAMAGMKSTGDADADYLLMMIPHHRSAVEMSEALLPQVKDPEVRALAEAVIATQEAEIASMKAMLARLGHPVD